MNRKIKFRAWDKVKQIWCNYKIDDGTVYFMDNDTGCLYRNYPGKYENFDLMQYTGIKDINNVEIFEGDIVKLSKENSDFKEIGIVKFDENKASYVLETQDDDISYNISYYNYHKVHYRVIGNIYENKELLEQK